MKSMKSMKSLLVTFAVVAFSMSMLYGMSIWTEISELKQGFISSILNRGEIVVLEGDLGFILAAGLTIGFGCLIAVGLMMIYQRFNTKKVEKKVEKKVKKKIGKTIVDNIKKVVPIKKEKDVEEIEAEFEEVKLEK